jgi:hypothetical protein
MVRPELVRAFDDACFVVEQEGVAELQRTLLSVASNHSVGGMLLSSMHLQAIDDVAANACKKTVERLYEHLMDLHGAEPLDGSSDKAEELAAMLVTKIDSAGRQLRAQRDEALERFGKSLGGNWSSQLKRMPQALDNARMMFASKARTAALGSANRGSYSMNHTVNVHGPVGAVQTGPSSTATVTQTINVPAQGEILAALEAVNSAIVAAQSGDPSKHADALEVIEELTTQAKKDKPNRLTVRALLSGLSSTLRGLAVAPQALETLTAWGHALGQSLPV